MSGLVLVTGGGGFLGQQVAVRLLQAGYAVRSFSRGRHAALDALGVEQAQGDLADAAAVSAAAEGAVAVLHVAAKPGVAGRYQDYFLTNVTGTDNVIAACRRHGIRRLVYTSSPSVVYGGGDQQGIDESAAYPSAFLAHYPATKALAERRILAANDAGLATVALRPHLIWGPGDNHLVPRILARARASRLRLVGDGRQLVDAVYVDNAADAHLLALEKLSPASPVAGKAYFITNHEPWPLADVVNGILAAAGLPPVGRTVPPWAAYAAGWTLERAHALLRLPGEPPLTRFVAKQLATAHWYDNTASKQELGYIPKVSMTEGFRRLARHLETRHG